VTLSQEQLEWIVSEVVRRLRADNGQPHTLATGAGTLALAERLVTVETVRNRLEGVSKVQVAPRAVVTPAVVDLLRERQVQLVRGTQT
jgi:hypothetical protein